MSRYFIVNKYSVFFIIYSNFYIVLLSSQSQIDQIHFLDHLQSSKNQSISMQTSSIIIHQKIQKINQLQNLQSPSSSQTSTNLINIPLGSVFVKKFSQKHKTQPRPTQYQQDSQQINLFHQNQLTKFKYYSKILQSSNTLSQFHIRENPSQKSQDQNVLCSNEELLPFQKLNDKQQTNQKNLIHNYYTSKNQRKNKVLNKAKQLGKNNFYKFLKQTAMIQNNKHFHRFRDQATKVTRKGSPPNNKGELLSEKEEISPIIFSFKSMKEEQGIMVKVPGQFEHHPETISIRQMRKRLRVKTESTTTQHKLLFGIMTQNNCFTELHNRQRKKMSKKGIVRSLTSINEQIRQNRQTKYKDQFLFKQQESTKIRNLQDLVQQWKYKSFFNFQSHSQEDPSRKNKKLDHIFQKQLFESKRPIKKSLFSSKQRQSGNCNKSQSIRNNNNFKTSLTKRQNVQNLSFNVKSLMPQIKQL